MHAAFALLWSLACGVAEPGPGGSDGGSDGGSGSDGVEEGPVSGLEVHILDTMGSIPVVSWTQAETATSWVEFSFEDDAWLASPAVERAAGSAEELVLGVPFGMEVQLRVHVGDAQSAALTIQTDPPPSGAPVPTKVEGEGTTPFVLTCIYGTSNYGNEASVEGSWTFVIDKKARLVWAKEAEPERRNLHCQTSRDGSDILIDQNSFWAIFDMGAAAQIWRMKIDAVPTQVVDTPGAHHPFTELTDGTLAYAGLDHSFMDNLWTISPEGETRAIWDCSDFHEAVGEDKVCASNTLFWDPRTDHFLFSIYSTDTVVEIDHQTGETLRWFGALEGSWAFSPTQSQFFWQHGVHYTEEGTLLVSTKDRLDGDETVVREYVLDEEAQTLTEVWNWGVGQGIYGPEMGEADFLPNGNVLQNYGSMPRMREGTPEGEVVWDVEWQAMYIGRHSPIQDLYALAP